MDDDSDREDDDDIADGDSDEWHIGNKTSFCNNMVKTRQKKRKKAAYTSYHCSKVALGIPDTNMVKKLLTHRKKKKGEKKRGFKVQCFSCSLTAKTKTSGIKKLRRKKLENYYTFIEESTHFISKNWRQSLCFMLNFDYYRYGSINADRSRRFDDKIIWKKNNDHVFQFFDRFCNQKKNIL